MLERTGAVGGCSREEKGGQGPQSDDRGLMCIGMFGCQLLFGTMVGGRQNRTAQTNPSAHVEEEKNFEESQRREALLRSIQGHTEM
jgi:hypothetical protein